MFGCGHRLHQVKPCLSVVSQISCRLADVARCVNSVAGTPGDDVRLDAGPVVHCWGSPWRDSGNREMVADAGGGPWKSDSLITMDGSREKAPFARLSEHRRIGFGGNSIMLDW